MDGMLDYERESIEDDCIARFGTLNTRTGSYRMPAVSPGVRTRMDVEALVENLHGGMPLDVITPYVSRARIIGPELERVLGGADRQVAWKRPLVIADLEAEALSFNCVARQKYTEDTETGTVLQTLLSTGLTGDRSAGRLQCHRAWREIERKFSYIPLVHWMGEQLAAVQADVFALGLPIVRADLSTVVQGLETAQRLLPIAQNMNDYATFGHVFSHFGFNLVLHADLFRQDESARDARAALINGVQDWHADSRMRGLVLVIKIYDSQDRILGAPEATAERQSLSELISNLRTAMEMSGGLLVLLDQGQRIMGMLDSGADVVSARVTGDDWIESPIANAEPQTGPRPPPDLMDPYGLERRDWEALKDQFERERTFHTPTGVDAEPFWEYSWSEGRVYEGRVQAGVYHDLGNAFRETALDPERRVRDIIDETVRRPAKDSRLIEFCPSLA